MSKLGTARVVVVSALVTLGFVSVVAGQDQKPGAPPAEIVVYTSDLPKSALFEFEVWSDSTSPGGKMVGTPNTGDMLHPPPEEDPHVRFKVSVQSGVPYRCWIHMKVGAPKGFAKANRLYVQFSNAVDTANKEVLKPGTASYLTVQGPTQQGWKWVGCEAASGQSSESLVYFRTSGEALVHVQAGMEGVAFDQFVVSPAQFLEKPPSDVIVKK